MKISINTRFAAYPYLEGYGYFTRALTQEILNQCPNDEFLFLFDQVPAQGFPPAPNKQELVKGPPARHPILWKYWYDFRIAAALKQFHADVFLSPDGICSMRSNTPQVIVIHDLAFMHFPEFLPAVQQQFYRFFTPRFIQRAARVVTVSEHSKQDILSHFPHAEGKIEIVPNAATPTTVPLDFNSRQEVKQRLTGGVDYLLYIGSVHPRKNLVNLLKGFSLFKKRQKNSMKLVIAGRMAWKNDDFQRMLSSYRFRQDVLLTGYLQRQELEQVLASAYALVNPSLWEGFGLPLIEAMQAGVPIICSGNSVFPEVAGDAALYFNPHQPEDIASRMNLVYTNETLASDMIAKGRKRATDFSWRASAQKMRQVLGDAAGEARNA